MRRRIFGILMSLLILTVLFGCSRTETSESSSYASSISYEEWNETFTPPAYAGTITEEINGGVPFFNAEELMIAEGSFESYAPLDELGRCGCAMAVITRGLMPTEERGDISGVYPSGWMQERYGEDWAYERCHLLAFCLTGQNANPQNLITGTHAFNQAMVPFEVEIAQDVEKFNDHVLVRVTPYFTGDDLVAKGVLYEAKSVATDNVEICVFIHNVSEIFEIDYATGQTTGIVNVTAQSRRDEQEKNKQAYDERMITVSQKYGVSDLPSYKMAWTP